MAYLLVHGGGNTGQDWEPTAGLLRAAGHAAVCPDLGDPAAHCLADHVAEVVAALEDLHAVSSKPVVLAGHSYGGMVVSEAAQARPGLVARLVYLDAALPLAGRSLFDLLRAAGFDPEADCGVKPLRPYTDPSRVDWTLLAPLDKLYIHCSQGVFAPATAQMLARAASAPPEAHWRTATLASGHRAHQENPRAVADLLLGSPGWP